MIRLWDTHYNCEIHPGFKLGPFKILAVDYVLQRILFSHHGSLKEMHQDRFVFK